MNTSEKIELTIALAPSINAIVELICAYAKHCLVSRN